MAFRRTPEMTRQVKNIVDALNHKRERMIRSGNYDVLPPVMSKKIIWDTILSSTNPQAAYDRLIGTLQNPGTLRQAMPSQAGDRYIPIQNSQGRTYAPASQDIDLAFNEISNVERQIHKQFQRDKRVEGYVDTNTGEIIEEDELDNIIEDIIEQGGSLSEEIMPDYGTYDSRKYQERVSKQFDLDTTIDTYLEVFEEYGFTGANDSNYFELRKMFDEMRDADAGALEDIFLSGDEEASADYIYSTWKYSVGTATRYKTKGKKNPNRARRNEAQFIKDSQRILRYWRSKYDEIMGVE